VYAKPTFVAFTFVTTIVGKEENKNETAHQLNISFYLPGRSYYRNFPLLL